MKVSHIKFKKKMFLTFCSISKLIIIMLTLNAELFSNNRYKKKIGTNVCLRRINNKYINNSVCQFF